MKKTGTEINKRMNNKKQNNLIGYQTWQASCDAPFLMCNADGRGVRPYAPTFFYGGGIMNRKNNWLIFGLAMVLYLIHSAAPSPAIYNNGKSAASVSTLSEVEGLTFFGLISISYGESADKKEEPEIMTETKTITGEVGGIGHNFISIIYKKEQGTDYELAITVIEEVKLKRIKTFKEIAPGDTVSVEYTQSTQEYEEEQPDGSVEKKTKVLSRVATEIELLRPASDSLRSEG